MSAWLGRVRGITSRKGTTRESMISASWLDCSASLAAEQSFYSCLASGLVIIKWEGTSWKTL